MFYRLLILFIVVPMIELALLIQVGNVIGFWPTIGIICATGLLGSTLTRQQGLTVWNQFNARLQKGELPGDELIDGLIILIAGAFLLTPGIITDLVGFIGLLPFSRKIIRNFAQKRLINARAKGVITFSTTFFGQQTSSTTTSVEEEPQWQGIPKEKPQEG